MTRSLWRAARLVFGVLILVWSLGPIYWAINVSFSTTTGLQGPTAHFLPDPPTTENYAQLLDPANSLAQSFYLAMRNSVIEAVAATTITVVIALFAGYAFARWRFGGSRTMFVMIIATLSLPLLAILIPLFKWAAGLHLLDTYVPVVLLAITASLPLAIWIMRSFVAALPEDIESAARIDGATEVQVLRLIVFPLLGPAVGAVAIIVFLAAWSAFVVPVFFTQTINTQPVTVFIPNLVAKQATNLGPQAAAAALSMLPPIVVVIALHRYLVSGLLRGASK